MDRLFSLEKKNILLTGGGRGIGAAITAGLQKAGANVGVFERDLPDPLLPRIKFYRVDMGKGDEVKESFDKFLADFGRIDVLINNAAMTIPSPSVGYSRQDWDATLSVNLSAVFGMCQLAGEQMIRQGKGGSIINFTSIGALQGFPNNPAYAASKGGVRQLTKALASEWGKHGIRVNNLAPGYTHTPMNQKSWDDPKANQARKDRTMLGRWAEPEDMLGPVIFLASDASRYVTGTDLYVDGGWTAKGI